MTPPHLTAAAITQVITKLARHQRTFLAIYGSGEATRLPLEGKGTVEVIPVRSELELREKLPPFGEQPYRAYLVPFAGNLPEDIGGRFVSNGKIELVGKMQQVASLTRTIEATIDVAETHLARYLLRADNETKLYPVKGQTTGQAELFASWLATDWHVPLEGGLALDLLLGWAVRDARGGTFNSALAVPEASGVEAELVSHLNEVLGPLGPAILDAWKKQRGADVLGFAALAEVLVNSDESGVQFWLRQKLRATVTVPETADHQGLVRDLAQLVRPVFSWLERRDPSVIMKVLDRAESLVDELEVRRKLITSQRLPVAWVQRLESLDDALSLVAQKRDHEALMLAQRAWRDLELHDFFQKEDPNIERLIRRAEMALRIATWLVVRPDRALVVPDVDHGDVEALGLWYAEEGGYLDWARRKVRGLSGTPLSAGAKAVVAAADQERAEMDRRFSKALSSWIHAGRPSARLLPIDKVLERIAAKFLKQSSDRSLLVLLMDGMAWAQAVELLPSLAKSGHFGPIAWSEARGNEGGRIGEGRYPVMLAALPTVTEVSRSAFFAGRLMKDGATLSTAKDPDHFGANKHIAQFLEPHLKPKLMLRGDGHTTDGALTEEALTMIRASKEQRIAAIVVNAIDASLKGDAQTEYRWDVESIRSLPQIFQVAREAGRHILMVADHGHVPADCLQNIGPGNGGGARYRSWEGDSDVLLEGERRFSGEGVYLARGETAVVLLEDDQSRYGGASHAGEHGGSSLAEVVAPCLLLGWDDPLHGHQDKNLMVRAVYEPDWWTRSLPHEVKAEIVRDQAASHRKRRPKVPVEQTRLFDQTPSEAPGPASEPPSQRPSQAPTNPAELLPSLYSSAMLAVRCSSAEERRIVVSAVHFLLARPGGVPASAFASHMNVPQFRVGGLVSKLQEALNLDGYEIVRLERQHQIIQLDKTKLEQQFEVQL